MKLSKANQERRRNEVAAADTLIKLQAIERRRNYKPGWALRLHEARLKVQTRPLYEENSFIDYAGL